MSYDKTIYKIIPFEDVKIGQGFEHSQRSKFSVETWVKEPNGNYRASDSDRAYGDAAVFLAKGCLARIADCEPQEPQQSEPVKTLIDEFAKVAMNGLMVNIGRNGYNDSHLEKVAERSYEMADAMMKAREGKGNE